jgi:Rod binding domain-containing protein
MTPDSFAAQSFASSGFLDAALAARPTGPRGLASAHPAKAAADFETFFISQVLETLQSGETLQSAFGGGPGETAFKSFLNDAYAQAVQRAGGIGLADRLKAEIIALQAQQQTQEIP